MKAATIIKPALCGLFLLCAGCASHPFAGWSQRDKALFATNLTCNAVDAWQTSWAMGEDGFKEGNPLLGDDPSEKKIIGFKLVGAGVTYWAASDPENRTYALMLMTVPCIAVLAHNYSEGARP